MKVEQSLVLLGFLRFCISIQYQQITSLRSQQKRSLISCCSAFLEFSFMGRPVHPIKAGPSFAFSANCHTPCQNLLHPKSSWGMRYQSGPSAHAPCSYSSFSSALCSVLPLLDCRTLWRLWPELVPYAHLFPSPILVPGHSPWGPCGDRLLPPSFNSISQSLQSPL